MSPYALTLQIALQQKNIVESNTLFELRCRVWARSGPSGGDLFKSKQIIQRSVGRVMDGINNAFFHDDEL